MKEVRVRPDIQTEQLGYKVVGPRLRELAPLGQRYSNEAEAGFMQPSI